MAANNLRGYLIMPNQTLQIPNGGSGGTTPTATTGSNGNASSFNHQNLYTAGQCTWYYLLVVLKLVVQLAHIGQTLKIGLMQLMVTPTK